MSNSLIAFQIRAGSISYTAIFPHSIDAMLDAMERFPNERISVRPLIATKEAT